MLEEIGLSLPLFIKWDDSEFGLRAKGAGYPTVTIPGAAVWHVPWTDKNDAVDWQSYFHQRNRFVAALLHSPYPRGGRLMRESLNHQIEHLVSMQYSTVELRHQALEDVLAGPSGCTRCCRPSSAEVNALPQAVQRRPARGRPGRVPAGAPEEAAAQGRDIGEIPGRLLAQLVTAGMAPIRQVLPAAPLSREYPEAEIAAMDAKWYRLAGFDSAVVSMNDGTSAALYQRDPAKFRELVKPDRRAAPAALREWPRLARGVPRRRCPTSPPRRPGRRRSAPGPTVTATRRGALRGQPTRGPGACRQPPRRAHRLGRRRRPGATPAGRPRPAGCSEVLRRRYLLG